MEKKEKLYSGKAKVMYATDDDNLLIQHFTDNATAFNGKKKGIIKNKGVINNKITEKVFKLLESKGIKTHFVDVLNDREMLVKKLDIVMVELVIRNYAAGSLVKRLGFEYGQKLDFPLIEYFYKSDELDDPMLNKYHIKLMNLCTEEELSFMEKTILKVNEILVEYFKTININLIDFKLEFGRFNGEILLGDEFTPDGSRLWEIGTNEILDKDRFRKDLGGVDESYEELCRRICGD